MDERGVADSNALNGGEQIGVVNQWGHQLICWMIEVFENPRRLKSFFSLSGAMASLFVKDSRGTEHAEGRP